MGLGKTVQCAVFLLAIIPERTGQRRTSNAQSDTVLVCAPASVIDNWERELRSWFQYAGRRVRVTRYLGTDRRRTCMRHLCATAIEAGRKARCNTERRL